MSQLSDIVTAPGADAQFPLYKILTGVFDYLRESDSVFKIGPISIDEGNHVGGSAFAETLHGHLLAPKRRLHTTLHHEVDHDNVIHVGSILSEKGDYALESGDTTPYFGAMMIINEPFVFDGKRLPVSRIMYYAHMDRTESLLCPYRLDVVKKKAIRPSRRWKQQSLVGIIDPNAFKEVEVALSKVV